MSKTSISVLKLIGLSISLPLRYSMNILLNHEPLTVHFGCQIDSCDIKEVLLQEHLFCLIMSQGVKGTKASSSDILDNDDNMLLLSEIIKTQQKRKENQL